MKKTLIVIAIIFLAIQFIPIKYENPAVNSTIALKPPQEIETLLKRACYDCHTNNTIWPIYSNIAPVSFKVAAHVNNGRKAINFSEYESIDKERKIERLKRAAHLIKLSFMPPASYTWMHGEANLNLEEKKVLINYFEDLLKKEEGQ